MMGHRHRRRFAVAALVVLAGFIASSCTALGVWPATSSFGASGKMTFALSDGATGGGPISVNLQRGGGGSNGITYVGTMSTGSGFNGPQGQFQVKLIGGAACYTAFGCDPTPGNPWGSWIGSWLGSSSRRRAASSTAATRFSTGSTTRACARLTSWRRAAARRSSWTVWSREIRRSRPISRCGSARSSTSPRDLSV